MHYRLPVLEAAIAMKRITTVAVTITTGQISVSDPMSQSHRCFWPSKLIITTSSRLVQLAWGAKCSCVLASLPAIFGFAADFVSQCGFCICQNVTMITLSVAGLLLVLNVALISSILSFDQLIGWKFALAASVACVFFHFLIFNISLIRFGTDFPNTEFGFT